MIRFLFAALLLAPVALFAGEESLSVPMHDGYALDAKIALPEGAKLETVKRAILLVHGSGAQTMDEDLTEASKGKVKNLVFRDLSDALTAKGFAVVRYHKRNYQSMLSYKADPKFKDSAILKAFVKDGYGYFVADIKSMLDLTAKKMPKAKLFLFGHSEGTYTGLQAVHERGGVSGVALLGFSAAPVECLVYEQVVYRPLPLIDALDLDHNGLIEGKELDAPGAIAGALKAQLAVVDLDGDGKLSRLEIQAGNFSNLLVKPLMDGTVQVYEGTHPTVAKILAAATYPVCFFSGMLDNQTPTYQTKALELVSRAVWKKTNFKFHYFEKLGHALDPRDSYEDIEFRPMDPAARAKVADEIDHLFVEQAGK